MKPPADIIGMVDEDARRIDALFQKALAASSAREKNACMVELKKLLGKHMVNYSTVVQQNDQLEGDIASTRGALSQVTDDYESLKESVAFLSKLEFYQAAPDVDSLKRMIRGVERDILAISPLADKNLLEVTNDYVDLLGVRETRLRQLVEAFKLRIRTAEQRLDSASEVIDEFGSITNLLGRVRHLREENDRLGVRELRFSRESLLKSRCLTKCEEGTLRSLLVSLQNELARAREEVAESEQKSEESLAVLPDETEVALGLVEQGLEFSAPLPALVRNPLELTPEEVEAVRNGISGIEPAEVRALQNDNEHAALHERTNRLRTELALRRTVERVAVETGRQRLDKLLALNERLLAEIHGLQEQADSVEATCVTLTDMLADVESERDAMEAKSAALLSEYGDLYKSHLALRQEFDEAWKAGAGLFRLAELFGKSYLAQVLDPTEFSSPVAAFSPVEDPIVRPDFTERPPAVLLGFFKEMHTELVRRWAARLGNGRKLAELREALSRRVVNENVVDVADVVEHAPQDVLEQLSGHGRVRAVFDELLVGIRAETDEDLQGYRTLMETNFGYLRRCSEEILCKVKRAMSTQTFVARRADVETQYIKGEIQKLAKAAATKK